MTASQKMSWEQAVRHLRERPESRQLVLDAYYDDPLIDAATRYAKSAEWTAVREMLPAPPARVLDVGAGRGIVSYALASSGYCVVALEPDPSSLVGAGAIRALRGLTGLNIEIVEDQAENVRLEQGSFDAICARAVLHHTTDLRAACARFHGLLRPGGLLIAFREHVISKESDLPAFFDKHPLHHLYGGENAYLKETYVEALVAAGFSIEGVLDPWESPINYAPNTMQSIKAQIAQRMSRGLRIGEGALLRIFQNQFAWQAFVGLVRRLDHRPGRLYSFVARA